MEPGALQVSVKPHGVSQGGYNSEEGHPGYAPVPGQLDLDRWRCAVRPCIRVTKVLRVPCIPQPRGLAQYIGMSVLLIRSLTNKPLISSCTLDPVMTLSITTPCLSTIAAFQGCRQAHIVHGSCELTIWEMFLQRCSFLSGQL